MDDVNIKKQSIASANEVILLCGHSKFESIAFIHVEPLDCIDRIIVGKDLPGTIMGKLRKKGIAVELVSFYYSSMLH
jgi:DeoR/GlpR family transcriptional regulator of sugar metabolism